MDKTMNMNHVRKAYWLFFFVLIAPVLAHAETSIAVVDVQRLLSESKAAKTVQTQLQGYQEKFLEELSQQEQDLRNSEKKLMDAAASLSNEELAKQKKALEERFVSARTLAQKRKRELDTAFAKAMRKLQEELYKAVESVAGEKGYDLVISRQHVVIGEKSMDISEETMKILNESVPEITLEINPN